MMSKDDCKKSDLESIVCDIDSCLVLLEQYKDDKQIERGYNTLLRAFNILSPVLERMYKKHDKLK